MMSVEFGFLLYSKKISMKVLKYVLAVLIIVPGFLSFGQIEDYRYKRDLSGITDQWHRIDIPNAVLSKLNRDFSDIRIFGFSPAGDTLEVPYLMSISTGEKVFKEVKFTLLNESHNANGYFYTFDVSTKEQVNQIELDFKQTNFDWTIKLEGSQNQQEWFTILDDYRILSINNELTNYKFSKLAFPDSKYRYYRLCVKSDEKPEFIKAHINLCRIVGAEYRDFSIESMDVKENKKQKQTIVDIDLGDAFPVGFVKVFVQNGFDFYRPLSIRYLTDSVKTDHGWRHNFTHITSDILTSFENSGIQVPNTVLKKMRLVIDNQNNQPLIIDSIVVKGFNHQLVARFQPETKFSIYYGNDNAFRPRYDIERFVDNIPENISIIEPGEEVILFKEKALKKPLFVNEAWLWLVMVVIILALGWFTLSMMKKTKS